MLGRQSVRVTYAHKRRRVHNASKKLLSSPLEVLPPDMDDLTRTQMAHRMLKRSRRVALAEQLEDENVEHIRDHLAKRIRRTQERVSNPEPAGVTLDVAPEDDFAFQTPFPSSQSVCESTVAVPLVPEQLSPVPLAKRVMSRTSSRNLKENSAHSQTLASPFSSRPGSAASSPRHKGKKRSSHRVSRISLHAKSRTLSGGFKENTRGVSRKDSTVSLKDMNREPSTKYIKHQRYPSSPSISYMRSQFPQEDWITPPKAFFRAFDDHDGPGSVRSNASFYADRPQSCSTPAISRMRKLPGLHGRQTRTDTFLGPSSLRKDSAEADGSDIEMIDVTVPPRRRIVHLSGNSIFSSSDEFTIGSLLAVHDGGAVVERNGVTDRNKTSARVVRQAPAHREMVDESREGYSLAGSFVAEYDIPLSDLDYSAASTVGTKTLGPEGVPKLSEGGQPFGLPGTSPAGGENLVIRTRRNFAAPKLSVGEQLFGLPGTRPARGANLVIRKSRNSGTLTPPPSPPSPAASCRPSSPASDLALELRSMGIRGDPDTHSGGETNRPSASIPLQTRSRSLRDAVAKSTAKKSVKQRPARNRASTIRASDFAKPGALSSGLASGLTIPPSSNVRRTRSGTVVGPESKLATEGAALPARATKGAAATGLAVVHSGSEPESDDELLLKGFWVEDVEYLGRAVPPGRKEVEADELNLGGLWHSLESRSPRRLGLRRR